MGTQYRCNKEGRRQAVASHLTYLFSWDDILRNDNVKLIDCLKQIFDLDWVTKANIKKIDGKTINVSTGTNSVSLELNDDSTKVILKIGGDGTSELNAKMENGTLNIYTPTINGIDYLEVKVDGETGKSTLEVHFIFPLSVPLRGKELTEANVVIEGGVRIKNVEVGPMEPVNQEGKIVNVTVNSLGDFSKYTLRIVKSKTDLSPPDGFDPQLSHVDFSFKVKCPAEFDCKPQSECPPEKLPEPEIDYLAKDYASFRRLMLDRLSVIMPDWRERNPADLQVALVEMLAYVGDNLSYFQDAVATDAYLGTARKRISLRRHARLLDYFMHEGCNARAWVCLEVDEYKAIDGKAYWFNWDSAIGKDKSRVLNFLMDVLGIEWAKNATISISKDNKIISIISYGKSVEITLDKSEENAILKIDDNQTYSLQIKKESGLLNVYGRPLPKGTILLTRGSDKAAVVDPDKLRSFLTGDVTVFETMYPVTLYSAHNRIRFYTWNDTACCLPRGSTQATLFDIDELFLNAGDVLVFEEVCSPTTGKDADPSHRHAVRLTKVTKMKDPLDNTPVVEIKWHEDDALPFPLCISAPIKDSRISDIAVARGNAVLVDHGRTVTEAMVPDLVPEKGSYCPRLISGPLTYREQFNLDTDLKKPAVSAMLRDIRKAIPAINLVSKDKNNEATKWSVQYDLLASDKFAAEFVVENELDGFSYLRFGDNILGEMPIEGSTFKATYRIGNGRAGNVGTGAISRIAIKGGGINRVRNPLPASGGTDPEPMEQVRLYAPQAFRTQERAVTEADYEEMAQKHPGVQKAIANIRWTGSWHTAFVTIDRKGGGDVNDDFKKKMLTFLDQYRIAGYDIEINSPIYVPLEIAMNVCVKPGYFRSNVKQSLLLAFSNHELVNGRRGFFHPDNFTFSQPVYLSRMYEAAMGVAGVAWVKVTLFQRWGKLPVHEIENGVLIPGTLEVIRLDNDPNFPENGKIDFNMDGGL